MSGEGISTPESVPTITKLSWVITATTLMIIDTQEVAPDDSAAHQTRESGSGIVVIQTCSPR
jgi:hypothetical protein